MSFGAHEPRIAKIKRMVEQNPDLDKFRFVFDWGMFVAEFEGFLVSADVWHNPGLLRLAEFEYLDVDVVARCMAEQMQHYRPLSVEVKSLVERYLQPEYII